jgi:maltooligosyltrehalose trehalohydrolase
MAHQPTFERPSWRRYPIGVELGPGGAHARVWAPAHDRVALVVEHGDGPSPFAIPLAREEGGYFSGLLDGIAAGTRYRFQLGDAGAFPDPASRFQPTGPHGPSEVVDPARYAWRDIGWRGVDIAGQVLYEMHIGTFTEEGTYRAAIDRLPDLVDVGVTVVELMPLADFPGRFGWGYDGVNLFAPTYLYGTPDDLRALVDAAHAMEVGVILDVVYNHLGPDGNYLESFTPRYFSSQATEWGAAINFDEDDAEHVREYFLTNAQYWIEEFHLDGLRLDATQQIFDRSHPDIVTEVGERVRRAARGRRTIVVAENEPQRAAIVRPRENGGCGLDALWNDDFHHSARVAATGRNEAYYSGYRGVAQELVSAAKYGFLYQGQMYAWQKQGRGRPAFDLEPTAFVNFLQNHDQVANGSGERLHRLTSPGKLRALTALLLLLPQTPMLFQGQEFAASAPFYYFADHNPELAALVRTGRATFLTQFPSLATETGSASLPDPGDPATFQRCKIDWAERDANAPIVALHRDLLALRRDDAVFRRTRRGRLDGSVLDEHAFVLRFFGEDGDDRLLIVNLGPRLNADPAAEPLVAPPRGKGDAWRLVFSTEDPRYGGWGTPSVDHTPAGWVLPAESAFVLAPDSASTSDDTTDR